MKSFSPPCSQHVPSGIFSSTYRAEMVLATAVPQQPLARSCVALSHGNPACPALARPLEQLQDLGSGSSYRCCFASSWSSPRAAQGLGQTPGRPHLAPAPAAVLRPGQLVPCSSGCALGPCRAAGTGLNPCRQPDLRPPCGSQACVRSLPSRASAASCPMFVLSRCQHLADESTVLTPQPPGPVPHPRCCTAAPAPGGEQGQGRRAGAAAPAAPDGCWGSSMCRPSALGVPNPVPGPSWFSKSPPRALSPVFAGCHQDEALQPPPPWTLQGPSPQHHEAPSPTASSWGIEFSHSSWPGRDRGRCYQGRAGCRARGWALIIKSQFHYSNLSPRATQARLSQGARPQQHPLQPWGTGTPRVGGSSPMAAPAPCGVPAPGCLSPSGAAALAPSALLQQAPVQHGQEQKAQESSSSCQQLLKQDLERSQNHRCHRQPPSLVGEKPLAGAGFGCRGGK